MDALRLVTYGAILLVDAVWTLDCVYYQEVAAGQSFNVYSPNYPNNYPSGISCTWEAVAPSNSHFILQCDEFSTPASQNCVEDRFSVSPSGDKKLADAHAYCGSGTFTIESDSNRIAMQLDAPYFSKGGKFMCKLTATVPSTPKPTCDCGWKKQSRIVNGRETGVNEYPMMAGLVDLQIRDVICGATVISSRYCLTAAHCLLNRQTAYTAILVGDHDISTGTETNSAKLLTTEHFEPHPLYNSATQRNDIAVVRVSQDIVFSLEVGPACLPFRFPTTAVGTQVDVLGWGTIEQGGPKSDKLLEAELYVVNTSACQQAFGSKVSTTDNLCTSGAGTDACQADSGGPVLWLGPSDRLQLVGIISYGRGCASEYPAVNTLVYSYINWILSVTPDVQYCVR
ncbi:Venom serine protease 34 [Cryptotermes secundus]|uniref:Venom serine protease 34 n=1 Tax=Cryptotermes secundus TaxID=105785 RepID=A0A2J7RQM9_9NEOP|nr:venom serine protease [Cryptotermes secundus]PNF43142.1 Venom serine protease 34 [Cryptotermes secundus]